MEGWKESYRRVRSWYKKSFVDRYIVLSSPNGNRSYRIAPATQLLLACAAFSFCLWLCFAVTGFFRKKQSVDVVYREMSELRSINDDLVNKIKLIDDDLTAFSNYLTGKKAAPKGSNAARDERIKKASDKGVKEKSEVAKQILEESVYNFAHSVNVKMGFLLNSIHGLGLDPYRFVPESKSRLEKVRLSNVKIVGSKSTPEASYKRRAPYYYYRPRMLDKSFGMGGLMEAGTKKVVSVLRSLETVFRSLPINSPLVGRYVITSRYGLRSDPFSSRKRMHAGIDLVHAEGAKILAAGSGVVAFAGYKGGYGYTVDINHGYGITSRYAHMKGLVVAQGQRVSASQHIGYQGRTGSRCKGSHLHYEIHQDNRTINPLKYLYAKNSIQKDYIAYFSGR